MSETPFQAPADDKPAPPPPHSRPRSLLVVAALSSGLGVFGLMGVAWGCFGSVVSLTAASAFSVGMSGEQAAAQAALMQASRPFIFVQMALFLAVIPLAVGLLIGGINVLTDKVSGHGWLMNAWLFGLVVEPVRMLVQVIQIVVLWDHTMAVSVAAASASGAGGAQPMPEEMMTGIVMGSMLVGQLVAFAWFAAKMALYFVGRRVGQSEATQDWILSKT